MGELRSLSPKKFESKILTCRLVSVCRIFEAGVELGVRKQLESMIVNSSLVGSDSQLKLWSRG